MSIHVTVAICTFNGANRIPHVLEQLKHQIGTEAIAWEILVIDNNSTDAMATVVQDYQQTQFPSGQLRYVFEPEQGLAIARQRAIAEAEGELIGFLDDDNVPAPAWVSSAYAFAQAHPQAGAYGSRIRGEFETPPPENFKRIAPLLAIIDRGDQALLYEPRKKVLPPGAGLVVRKQAWLANVPERCFLQGRFREPYLPGEDLEALLYIQKGGWEIWYNPAMQVVHQIPSGRLQPDYLHELCRGVGLSRYHTRMLSVPPWQAPVMSVLYPLNDIYKLCRHWYQHRGEGQSDLVTTCELELLVGCLLSPFYVWKAYLKEWVQTIVSSIRKFLSRNTPAKTYG